MLRIVSFGAGFLVRSLLLPVVVVAMACSTVGAKILQMDVGRALRKIVRLRSSSYWSVRVKYGPHGELFFFFFRKEPVALTEALPLKPAVPAETLKVCALIGLHQMAAEGEAGSSGSQSLDLGDMWRHGCQKSPDWDSEGEPWSESEGLRPMFASTLWKALLCMLPGKIGQAKRCPSS